jgi:hypothetical protein
MSSPSGAGLGGSRVGSHRRAFARLASSVRRGDKVQGRAPPLGSAPGRQPIALGLVGAQHGSYGRRSLRMDATHANRVTSRWPPGRRGSCREPTARSPRNDDDGRPLDVAPGAVPLGTALLREQVLVGSAGSLAACRWRNCTEGGWSAVSRTAAGSPDARASARSWRRRRAVPPSTSVLRERVSALRRHRRAPTRRRGSRPSRGEAQGSIGRWPCCKAGGRNGLADGSRP